MKMQIPEIPQEDQKNPTVAKLVELLQLCFRVMQEQAEEISHLKDEIAKLKGQKPRPKIPPSKMADDAKNRSNQTQSDVHRSSYRKSRKNEQRIIFPKDIPLGSVFKGYDDYSIQDISIESMEIQFRLAVYLSPEGIRIRGELPPEYQQGHFGAELIAYCLSQYYQCHVTEPLLLEQLYEMGIDISPAQLSNILIQDKEDFHEEKEEILKAGLINSEFINVDDTGARHDGKNGYCTAMSSPLFTYFESTDSKSRINFLKILQGKQELYTITEEALNYAFEQGIGEKALSVLENNESKCFHESSAWEAFLKRQKIESEKDLRIATEGVLLGGVFEKGINNNLITVSDAAGQFAVFQHGLCWVHEERHYRKLIPLSCVEETEIEMVRSEIWDFYEALKKYKKNPTVLMQNELTEQFDKIFGKTYKSMAINSLLDKTRSRKEALLLVLKYPFIPLHNNDCERDIREYVKRRKISGSTRSDAGRKARDTFTSLKKTCLKLGVIFYGYLKDRLINKKEIPRLADLIAQKSRILLTCH